MPTSYKESARRHKFDGDYLWDSGDPARKPNASQLFGLSAECSLKAVLVGLGLPTKADGTVADTRKYWHINALWNEFSVYASGAVGGKYVALIQPSTGAATPPFSGWSVHDRYAPDGLLSARLADFTLHKDGAHDCITLLEQAEKDGVVL